MQPVRAAREDDASRTIRGSGRHGVRGSWTRISDESVGMTDELTRTTVTKSTDGGEFLRAAQERQRSRCEWACVEQRQKPVLENIQIARAGESFMWWAV